MVINFFLEKRKLNLYGILGLIAYYFLSLPFLRTLIFGSGAKILDIYDASNATEVTDAFSFFTQYALYFPYILNEYLFRYFEFLGLNVLVLAIMSPIVYRYYSYAMNCQEFFLLFFLFLPAPLLFLSSFNKEVILVIAFYFSYGYRANLTARYNHIWFFLYAFTMRGYLMLTPFVLSIRRFLPLVIVSLLIIILGFDIDGVSDVFDRLFNRRLAEKGYSANSEIYQSVHVVSFLTLILMLIEVVPQIILPIFYDLSIKSVFFQIYILLLFFLCFRFRSKYSNLMLVLVFFYIILDPDLGAYFRHLTSFFILYPLILGFGDRHGKA